MENKITTEGLFCQELRKLINRHSMENGSDTPDFMLATYLTDCLIAFNHTLQAREKWYGRTANPITGSLVVDKAIE